MLHFRSMDLPVASSGRMIDSTEEWLHSVYVDIQNIHRETLILWCVHSQQAIGSFFMNKT